MKGHIAQRYGELVKDLWSGTAKSIAPLKLRVNSHLIFSNFISLQKHIWLHIQSVLGQGCPLYPDLSWITRIDPEHIYIHVIRCLTKYWIMCVVDCVKKPLLKFWFIMMVCSPTTYSLYVFHCSFDPSVDNRKICPAVQWVPTTRFTGTSCLLTWWSSRGFK